MIVDDEILYASESTLVRSAAATLQYCMILAGLKG